MASIKTNLEWERFLTWYACQVKPDCADELRRALDAYIREKGMTEQSQLIDTSYQALERAVRDQNLEQLKRLEKAKANFFMNEGELFLVAASIGSIPMLKYLDSQHLDRYRDALLAAIPNGHYDAVEWLLHCGVPAGCVMCRWSTS